MESQGGSVVPPFGTANAASPITGGRAKHYRVHFGRGPRMAPVEVDDAVIDAPLANRQAPRRRVTGRSGYAGFMGRQRVGSWKTGVAIMTVLSKLYLSSCAVHNGPTLPTGSCDYGLAIGNRKYLPWLGHLGCIAALFLGSYVRWLLTQPFCRR